MVVYRSAYQRFFQGPDWDEYSKEEYRNKVKYRSERRSVEHQHHVWLWDSEGEEDDIEEVEDENGNHVGGRTQVHEKEGENKKPREAWADRGEPRPENRTVERNKVDDKTHKSKHDRGHDDHIQAREKQSKYYKKRTLPSRSVKGKQNPAPFVAYGWANDGKVDKKRTHNVLASSAEVYPAALRAAKRRELDVNKKVQKYEEAIKKKEIPMLPDSPRTENPKTMWTTEYQRNFCRDKDINRHFPR